MKCNKCEDTGYFNVLDLCNCKKGWENYRKIKAKWGDKINLEPPEGEQPVDEIFDKSPDL